MSSDRRIEWVIKVRDSLRQLLAEPNVPDLDIGWLLTRCEDTLRYSERLQAPSAQQLVKDLRAFDEEFPGILPKELLSDLSSHEGS